MASPQCEDGYLQIAMELVDKFSSSRFAGQEWQIIWTVWRKTWGWKKKNDRIALSQFAQATGIDRRKCHSLIQNLMKRNILDKYVTHNGDKRIIKYGFNKDFEKWKLSPKKVTVTNKGDRVSPIKMTKLSPKKAHTKDTIKETITKDKILTTNPDIKKFIDHYHNTFLERFNEKPMIDGGKDGKIIKSLLGTYEIDLLKELLDKFFNSTDEFILRSGYTIGVFKSQINKLIAGLKVDPKTASRFITIKQWETNDGK